MQCIGTYNSIALIHRHVPLYIGKDVTQEIIMHNDFSIRTTPHSYNSHQTINETCEHNYLVYGSKMKQTRLYKIVEIKFESELKNEFVYVRISLVRIPVLTL